MMFLLLAWIPMVVKFCSVSYGTFVSSLFSVMRVHKVFETCDSFSIVASRFFFFFFPWFLAENYVP
jgi:hypothetical protein